MEQLNKPPTEEELAELAKIIGTNPLTPKEVEANREIFEASGNFPTPDQVQRNSKPN